MKDTTFSSKAYGTHEYKDLTIEGRVQFDVYMALQRDHKLSSYTLNAVSFGLEVSVLHTVPKHLSFESGVYRSVFSLADAEAGLLGFLQLSEVTFSAS